MRTLYIVDDLLTLHLARQVVLLEQRCDGQRHRGTEARILDIYRDRNARIILRSEREEGRMILSVGILCRTGLTSDIEPLQSRPGRRSINVNTAPHTLHDRLEVLGIDLRVVALIETPIE